MCEPIPHVEFITDASYVCRVVEIIVTGCFQHVLHKFSNGDLVRQLAKVRHLLDLWFVAGNMCADAAANTAYMAVPSEVRALADDIVNHMDSIKKLLHDHFKFLADFNRCRCRLLDEKKKDDSSNLLRLREDRVRMTASLTPH